MKEKRAGPEETAAPNHQRRNGKVRKGLFHAGDCGFKQEREAAGTKTFKKGSCR